VNLLGRRTEYLSEAMADAHDDQERWERLSRGDASAFEGFYREHAARLQSFLRQYVGEAKAAEDIAQEAFLRLWQRPNGFNPRRGTLRAYLFGIGTKCAADWRRRLPLQATQVVPEGRTERREPPLVMADALERLDSDARGLLWLREAEGYSYAELGEILGIPIGTVKSRLFTAREQLRRIWKGEES
jgi:RNA polymerase sigma-70 factor, ECF subfamily